LPKPSLEAVDRPLHDALPPTIGAQDVHRRTYVISVTCDARRVPPDHC